MKFFFNSCSFYFSLWCIYLLQGTLYESGSMLSQVILALILAMSLMHAWRVRTTKLLYFKGYYLLLIMFTFYGILLLLTDGSHTQGLAIRPATINYTKAIYISLLPICSCYYYTKKGYLNNNTFPLWVCAFFIVAVAEYFRLQREVLEKFLTTDEDITNNMGYIFVGLMPCFLVFKKKLYKYIGIVACMLFVLFSMKRGAMIVGMVGVLIILYTDIKHFRGVRKNIFILLVGVVGFVVFSFLQDNLFQNDFFNQRIEQTMEGSSSGRDVIYSTLWNSYINKFNIFHQLFGMGADGTLKVTFNYAHNDWLEILINQGLVGVVLFFSYWIFFIRTVKDNRYSLIVRQVLFIIFVITFLRTLFSMSINDNSIFLCSALGFALADGFGMGITNKI